MKRYGGWLILVVLFVTLYHQSFAKSGIPPSRVAEATLDLGA